MPLAHDLIGREARAPRAPYVNPFPRVVGEILPILFCLRAAKNTLFALVISILIAAAPAFAHQGNFFPIGWSGPWFDGSTAQYHPERFCGLYYPSYACLVASTSYAGVGLVRWPILVTNNQGLAVRYCTNDRDTKGWIVVVGQTGLSWSFRPEFDYSTCNTPKRCNMFTPGIASSIASQPWNSSSGTYYQATHQGNSCW